MCTLTLISPAHQYQISNMNLIIAHAQNSFNSHPPSTIHHLEPPVYGLNSSPTMSPSFAHVLFRSYISTHASYRVPYHTFSSTAPFFALPPSPAISPCNLPSDFCKSVLFPHDASSSSTKLKGKKGRRQRKEEEKNGSMIVFWTSASPIYISSSREE